MVSCETFETLSCHAHHWSIELERPKGSEPNNCTAPIGQSFHSSVMFNWNDAVVDVGGRKIGMEKFVFELNTTSFTKLDSKIQPNFSPRFHIFLETSGLGRL